MRDISSFHETFSEEGGWFDPNNFHQVDRNIIFDWITPQIENIIQSHIKNTFSPFSVKFAVINNSKLNAAIRLFVHEDTAFIGLNVGAAAQIFNYFFQALSHPDLFLNIGNPRNEEFKKKKILGLLLNLQVDGSFNTTFASGQPLIEYHPDDKIRLDYARLLSLHSIIFLIEHEIGHLVNGHLSLRSLNSAENALDNLSEQVLEMDADTWAISQAVARILGHISQPPDKIPEPLRWVYSSFEEDISAWLLSLTSLFLLWSSDAFDINQLEAEKYPPAPIRASYLGSTTLEYLNVKSTVKYVKKFEAMNYGAHVLKQSLETISLVSGNSYHTEEIKKAFSEPALIHLERLLSRWKEIRPRLEPFAYVRELPN